jgi:hypothetical protein
MLRFCLEENSEDLNLMLYEVISIIPFNKPEFKIQELLAILKNVKFTVLLMM